MKTRAASQPDFIEENVIVDFWSSDVVSAYGETYEFRWERRDRNAPDVRGLEALKLTLLSPFPGRRYLLPSWDIRAEYSMSTPSKGEGARAVDIQGVVSVVGNGRVWLDLKARMERLDVPGVMFDEAVRGHFAIAK